MGRTKKNKIKIVNNRKWHIQKEKFLKQEEIKEERITKLLLLQCTHALTAVLQSNITEFVKSVAHTEVSRQ